MTHISQFIDVLHSFNLWTKSYTPASIEEYICPYATASSFFVMQRQTGLALRLSELTFIPNSSNLLLLILKVLSKPASTGQSALMEQGTFSSNIGVEQHPKTTPELN
jgi:hypothetical protein